MIVERTHSSQRRGFAVRSFAKKFGNSNHDSAHLLFSWDG